MKPPYELDERVVVAETVGPRTVGKHHQECPRRRPPVVSIDDAGALSPSCNRVSQNSMQSIQQPEIKGRVRSICRSSSWGPMGNLRKGWQTSAVGPEEDDAPFLFFEVGTAVFLPCKDDMSEQRLKNGRISVRNEVGSGARAWRGRRVDLQRLGLGFSGEEDNELCSLFIDFGAHGQTSVVYLKSAELGMTYLDCTEWENAKYCKRDFFIRCGSDNVRICGI
ncbi:hypothetical protein GOBAR_AA06544 [Gossypium barbadense]|uniref:Uncharacterized protein n=1 Tax=Gossypium barbadense TaxID=3634 RepID=A0A2P5YEP6_GOSBA|nr:hypothetical protein GOBAR_AA06544 [Gossypium barbadense]